MSPSEPFYIADQGLVLPGHVDLPATARATAEAWLKDHGVSPFYAAVYAETAAVELAWMADGAFVQQDHEGAEPVTVVLVPAPPTEGAS